MFLRAAKSGAVTDLLSMLLQQHRRSRTSAILHVFVHWGGLGLVPLAILDSSLVPTFGSLDVLTAFLSASHAELWPYYAGMATLGAMIGSYITYKLGRRPDVAGWSVSLAPAARAR